jgi:hypothetical protein
MTSHFIITSAIHTSYGKCSTEERIEQTRETIKSIETYAPGSSMVIIDCGEESVNKNLFDCELIDYTKNEEIQYNLQKYLETKNKVLILKPKQSPHFYNFDVSSSMFSYMTRCWSFDSSLLLKIIETYDKMKQEIIHISRTEKQGDIEHLLYKHLNKNIITHANIMGIEGYWAPRREWIEE